MEQKICSSTKKRVTNSHGSAIFKCPKCGKTEIIRSAEARKNVAKYICTACGFEGPN